MQHSLIDQEAAALCEKLDHPEKKVVCPKCGNEILLIEYGSSCIVKCATPGCLQGSLRGI